MVKELSIAQSAIHSAQYHLQKYELENLGSIFVSRETEQDIKVLVLVLEAADAGIGAIIHEIYA